MNWFSTPTRIDRDYVLISAVFYLALLLLAPDSVFQFMNTDWRLGFIVLPFTFFAGLASAWIFYRNNDSNRLDPFYIRAWGGLIGGLTALPICLLFRASVAHLAFIMFTFGAGPVLAFHAYRRITKHKRA
jgi:hypothetical protein